jgi:3-hydroxybutyryl-CoA dehydrogenase
MPLVAELADLCLAAEHIVDVYLVEDFLDAMGSGYPLAGAADVDVAIEVHNQSPAAKQELLLALADVVPQTALILTSALATSATQAASWVVGPERVVGFGAVPSPEPLKQVELARALQTGDKAFSRAAAFWQGLGLDTLQVADGPGLVRARVLCCLINEAANALMEGIATAGDIDQAMKLGTGYPLGPLEWGDLIGLDTVLGVMNGLFEEWGDDRYRPTPLLKRMVAAGRLGLKSGRGFYGYSG